MKFFKKAAFSVFIISSILTLNAQPQVTTDSLSLKVNRTSPLHNDYLTYGFQQAITGKGVIIGIVDIGFQINHPAFLDKTGSKNRIVRFWDQGHNTGTPPAGFNYGTLYTNVTQIDYKDYDGTHGTHVAGIAAGSGYGTPNFNQAGNAPDAELVFVQIRYRNDTIPSGARGDHLVANPSIIDAYDYIFKYADSVGKPAVINLSWGMHTGPHDGTSAFDKALDALVGPGKVIVGSAGNDRGRNLHFEYEFTGDTVSAWIGEGIKRDLTYESVYADFWGDAGKDFSTQITLYDTLGILLGEMPFVSSTLDRDTAFEITVGTDTVTCRFDCVASSPLNGKPNIHISAFNNHPLNRYIVIRLTSADCHLHAWNSGGVDRWTSGGFNNQFKGQSPYANMKIGDNDYIMGENGGTANGVITVGAYTTSFFWTDYKGDPHSTFALPGYIAGFSSWGPTVDGRTKPDIVAPGVMVSSAFNKYAPDSNSLTYISADTNYYGAWGGTSMASPQVSGIVALMLQLAPTLTNEQVRDILHSTAATDTATGTTPNTTYGWGKVDALAALQELKGITSIKKIDNQTTVTVFPNPATDQLNVYFSNTENQWVTLNIFSMTGQSTSIVNQKIHTQNGIVKTGIQNLPAGIYFLQIETTNGITTHKFIKR